MRVIFHVLLPLLFSIAPTLSLGTSYSSIDKKARFSSMPSVTEPSLTPSPLLVPTIPA
jgi:hypothetical protein